MTIVDPTAPDVVRPAWDRTRPVPADSWPDVLSLGPSRLLVGTRRDHRVDLAEHRRLHPVPTALDRSALAGEARTARLLGRGGAAFPVERKLLATPEGAATRVVVNGSESEPASLKDRTLLRLAPHLVLDGALAVAHALGTRHVIVTVHDVTAARSLEAARAERTDARAVSIDASDAPFVGGEARSVVNRLSGRPAVPGGRRVLPSTSGVEGRPTFLSNVETFAQLGWLAAHGAAAMTTIGTADEPGTTIATLVGDVEHPGVVEVPHGARIDAVTGRPGATVLVGGYHGSWVVDEGLTAGRTGPTGRTWGAGVVAVLPDATCPLDEVARVTRWLAEQSVGQCGPCAFGLPSIADDVDRLVRGDAEAAARLRRRLGLVAGRGACAHPDGTSRFVASALSAFADDVERHRAGGCGRPTLGVLPVEAAA